MQRAKLQASRRPVTYGPRRGPGDGTAPQMGSGCCEGGVNGRAWWSRAGPQGGQALGGHQKRGRRCGGTRIEASGATHHACAGGQLRTCLNLPSAQQAISGCSAIWAVVLGTRSQGWGPEEQDACPRVVCTAVARRQGSEHSPGFLGLCSLQEMSRPCPWIADAARRERASPLAFWAAGSAAGPGHLV